MSVLLAAARSDAKGTRRTLNADRPMSAFHAGFRKCAGIASHVNEHPQTLDLS